jgi:glycyl-tRNA synthetase
MVVRKQRLPSSTKVAIGLAVCSLANSPTSEGQYVLAVSDGNHSIHLFTLDFISPKKGFGKLQPYTTLRDVHPFSITKIAFSTFIPPSRPVTGTASPQFLKLASVSVGNTVVVHTMPLFPYQSKSKNPRYVLVKPSELWSMLFSGFMALVVVAIGAFFLQAFTEIRGGVPPMLGAVDWLSPRLRDILARPYMVEGGGGPAASPSHATAVTPTLDVSGTPVAHVHEPPQSLRSLISLNRFREASEMGSERLLAIIVQDHGHGEVSAKSVGGIDGAEDMSQISESFTQWEDLTDEQRQAWKSKLLVSGHLAASDEESVLHGVYFSELAN